MYNKEYDVPFHYDEGRGGWWLQAKLVPPGCGMTVDTAKLLRRRQECYAAYRKQCSSPYTPTANKLMNAIRALHRGPNRISSVEAVTDNVFANMKKEAGHLPAGNSPSDPPPNKPGGRKRLDYNADDDDDWNYYYLGTKQSLGAKAGLTSLQFHIDNCHSPKRKVG